MSQHKESKANTKHTPTPWNIDKSDRRILGETPETYAANTTFIVEAVNNHERLIRTAEELQTKVLECSKEGNDLVLENNRLKAENEELKKEIQELRESAEEIRKQKDDKDYGAFAKGLYDSASLLEKNKRLVELLGMVLSYFSRLPKPKLNANNLLLFSQIKEALAENEKGE